MITRYLLQSLASLIAMCFCSIQLQIHAPIAGEMTQQWPLSATVDLDAMDYSQETGVYSTRCRCGASYTLAEAEMERGVDTVCCSTCSLAIRVLYQPADEEEEGGTD